jgi:hypothetical protein
MRHPYEAAPIARLRRCKRRSQVGVQLDGVASLADGATGGIRDFLDPPSDVCPTGGQTGGASDSLLDGWPSKTDGEAATESDGTGTSRDAKTGQMHETATQRWICSRDDRSPLASLQGVLSPGWQAVVDMVSVPLPSTLAECVNVAVVVTLWPAVILSLG